MYESGITLVLSEPGTGKTSLLMAICKQTYLAEGKKLLSDCCEILNVLNRTRKVPFELPTEPPIYTSRDCPAKFHIGYNKWYTPFMLNPYYISVNSNPEAQYLLPCSVIFIPELQKYTNSRKGQSLKENFYRVFEIYRHWHLRFYMDGHRGSFIDLRVRAMTRHVIEVQRQEHERDIMRRIIKTTWYCREFFSLRDYDDYMAHDTPNYTETKYVNEGNIFDCYDSFSCRGEFIPPEGKTFSMIKPLSQTEVKKLPTNIAKYYDPNEPAFFRGKEDKEKEPKSKGGKKEKEDKANEGTA